MILKDHLKEVRDHFGIFKLQWRSMVDIDQHPVDRDASFAYQDLVEAMGKFEREMNRLALLED